MKASLSVKDVADVEALFPSSIPTLEEFYERALSDLKEARLDILSVAPNLRSFENTYLAFDALLADAACRIQILWVVSLLNADASVQKRASALRAELRHFVACKIQGCRSIYETFKDFNDCLFLSVKETEIRDALMTQFRRQGMELSESDFDVLSTLKGELLKLESAYMENIHNRRRSIAFTLEELEGVDEKLLATFEQREGKFILYSNCPIVSLLESCTEANTRKALYEFMNVQCAQDNEEIVKDLIAKRDRFAKLLGYSSFATYQLEEEMVKDEKGVRAFLENLSAVALPKARKEAGLEPIEPYDVARLCRPSFSPAEFQRHLPFHKTFSSVMEALSRITGLQFVEKTASLWDPGVKLVEVSQKGTLIGFIAYDLAARSSKHVYGYCIDVLPQHEGAAVAVVISKFEDVESGLTPENLLTLLHESGHACHQLLGKALRPSKCGYHVASDFLEVPSTLFEELGWY
ncbi:MAG: hypothetical protein KDK48_02980, partial [Chlamydiia bacterium]|nr:hypothetical protein [Chlamydiia bacterium]